MVPHKVATASPLSRPSGVHRGVSMSMQGLHTSVRHPFWSFAGISRAAGSAKATTRAPARAGSSGGLRVVGRTRGPGTSGAASTWPLPRVATARSPSRRRSHVPASRPAIGSGGKNSCSAASSIVASPAVRNPEIDRAVPVPLRTESRQSRLGPLQVSPNVWPVPTGRRSEDRSRETGPDPPQAQPEVWPVPTSGVDASSM